MQPSKKDAQFTIAESEKAMDGFVLWDQGLGSRIDADGPGTYAIIAKKNSLDIS
jgi:hypothetical protein